ncbi:MAG: beta-galactosidase [Armatimonadota bacterium]
MSRFCIVALMIALLSTLAVAQEAEEVQLLANQGFEDGLDGWGIWPEDTGSTRNVDTDVVFEGEASLRVDATSPGDRAFVLQSTADFETGVIYRISVAIRKDATVPDSAVGFLVNWREGGESNAILKRAHPMDLQKEQEGDWERWSGLFVAEPSAGSMQVLLRVEYAVGSVWFDDLTFEDLGPPGDITPDVWSYLPIGVEIGAEPAGRFAAHKEAQDEAYQAAARYNDLLMRTALLEARLRELDRCMTYEGEAPSEHLHGRFEAVDELLNTAYLDFAAAFRSGEQDDWDAFAASADRTEANVELVSLEVKQQYNQISPPRLRLLPESHGEQPRAMPPFTDDGSRMNRLLIGAWSPTGWREFEEPFDFEFHSSAPGAPKVHTPDELDFSNITEKCDSLEEMGYAGTFAYLHFGIHDLAYAPDWFIEQHADEPDLIKISQDGLRGRSRGSDHSLNYYHPAVREYIRDYLGAYAEFCADEPRVFFHEIAQEAYQDFSTEGGARRQPGFGPAATASFHEWLAAEYDSIAGLNEAWGTDYASFDAIEQPDDRYVNPDREITPLVAEFERFIEDGYLDYLQLIYESLKAGDPNKPVAARHSGLLTSVNGARAFEHCDVLGYHRRAPHMQVMNLYLNTLSRYNDNKPLAYLEDFWGTQQESDRVGNERIQRRGLEKHVSRTFAWGRSLQMKWYAYTTGSYLHTYNGNWFNPRYDVLTMRYCAPALKVALDRARELDHVLTQSHIPQFRVAVWQPSASMRVQARRGLSVNEIVGIHGLIYPAGFPYELVPEEYFADGRAEIDDFDVVFLPAAEYLAEEHQRRLIDYVREGGTLIASEPPGVRDELARPSGLLLREVFGIHEVAFDEEAREWSWQSERCPQASLAMAEVGGGSAYITPATLIHSIAEAPGTDAIVDLLAERVSRDAWAENARFEVITRVTDEGERYLFVLNPSAEERLSDRVMVACDVSEATDVSVERGFAVPITPEGEYMAVDLTLGAGEMAVLWVR